MDAKSGLIGALGGEAVFELAEEVEGALALQTPGEIDIGDDIRGAAHAVLIGTGSAQIPAKEHIDLAAGSGAFVEMMQDQHADAVGVDLEFGESVEKAQSGTDAGDVVVGHVGQVAGEHVEDHQAGGIGLEAVEEAGNGAGIADVEGVEVEGDVFAEQIYFIGREGGSESLKAATEVEAGGILAVVDHGQGRLGWGLPGRAGGGEADGEIEREEGFAAARLSGQECDRAFGQEAGDKPVEGGTGDVEEVGKGEDACFHNSTYVLL